MENVQHLRNMHYIKLQPTKFIKLKKNIQIKFVLHWYMYTLFRVQTKLQIVCTSPCNTSMSRTYYIEIDMKNVSHINNGGKKVGKINETV